MRLPSRHTLRWLVPVLIVITLGTATVSWVQAQTWGAHVQALAIVAGLSALMAIGWLIANRAAVAKVLATARMGSLRTRMAGTRIRLEDILHSQGRFVGNIAHELKSPLATAMVQVDLLRRCSDDQAAVQALARSIGADLQHLADLVSSFLRLARPLAQADTSHHVPVDVHDFVTEAVAHCQPFAQQCGVGIVTTLANPGDDGAPEVLGDAVLLRAMIENLLRNAVRFSPRESQVALQVHWRGDLVVLTLTDRGTGVAAADLESVFEWFFTDTGQRLPSSGTGFGLAIAKRVAEHHGGTIALRNLPAGGCEFEVLLPCWRSGDPPAAAAPPTGCWPA